MRRKDKQITDRKLLHEILRNNTICRLALCDGEKPYIIPMNYGYEDNAFYVHTALEGKKLQIIKKNTSVCVEVSDSIDILTTEKGCGFGTKYRSVICTGTVNSIIETKQKVEGLKILMKQHTGKPEWDIPDSAASKVAVLKIEIEAITGKISGF